MTEYNLTWEEAKKALKLGAVVQSKDDQGSRIRMLPRKEGDSFSTHSLCGFGDYKYWMPDYISYDYSAKSNRFENFKFKITGIVSCEVNHQFNKHYIRDNSFRIACNTHYTFALYKGDNPKAEYGVLINECVRVITEEVLSND